MKGGDLWGIYTVWHRNYRLFIKTFWINCVAPMSEPLIYLLGFGYGLLPLVGAVTYRGYSVDYLEFLAPGMIAVGVLFQSFYEASYGSYLRYSYQKTWHVILAGPVTFRDIFIGEWLWAATRGIVSGVITAFIASLLGAYHAPDLLISLPVIVTGSLVFSSLGLCTAGIVRKVDQINVPIFVLIVPMFVLSGTYFPMEGLPGALKVLVAVMPLAAFVDLLRWPIAVPQDWFVLGIWLVLWAALLALAGYRIFYRRMFP